MSTGWRIALIVALASGGGGCARAHLTEAHGESVRAALHAQAAPAKKRTNAIEGLDSQEAAIIAGSYRRSLAPKDVKPQDQPVILVAPPGPAQPRQQLAPSVPQER